MAREHDVTFATEECLWRRVERGDVKGALVKPSRLRLQISIIRERHGTREQVPYKKWNGIAEAHANAVAAVCAGNLRVVCVDEPMRTCRDDGVSLDGHAVIAIVTTPGDETSVEEMNAARASIAATFTIIQTPT